MKLLKALQSLQEGHCHYCDNVIEAFQCSVIYTIKYTSAFTMLSMISLCVIAA